MLPKEMALETLLHAADHVPVLRPLDKTFARFLLHCDPNLPINLAWLAAIVSQQLADGHLCLNLHQLDVLADEQHWPQIWRERITGLSKALPASPLLADANGDPANAPLIHENARLYLRRYWNYECAVAHNLLRRAACIQKTPSQLAAQLQRYFPASSPDWQRIACALMTRSQLGIITGGPGTGKTTTVMRLLTLLQTLHLQTHTQPLRIQLAAPTGKAAARLNDTISQQLANLEPSATVRDNIPTAVTTLHRLLGTRIHSRHVRYHEKNLLPLDVLVIDEASMVDMEMMSAVLAALPATAKLILLGDKDQLASVEAGAVLGDLCERAGDGHYSTTTAQWLVRHSADDISQLVQADARPLDQCVAMLRTSRRFDASSGIGELAQAVNAGDKTATLTRLTQGADDLSWLAEAQVAEVTTLAVEGYRFYIEWLHAQRPAGGDDTALNSWVCGALNAFNRFQLLCALRPGPHGVTRMNQHIVNALQQRGFIKASSNWYEGRPVLITANDYTLGLMNGDIGLCLRLQSNETASRQLRVAFRVTTANGPAQVRFVSPSRLPAVETAFALTVHKAQGSEFHHTALLLPNHQHAVLTRELLYTGITRARQRLTLIATAESVITSVGRRSKRHSGLAARLWPVEQNSWASRSNV